MSSFFGGGFLMVSGVHVTLIYKLYNIIGTTQEDN